MRTRLLVVPIILACFLMGCATWKSEMTRAYKATGTLGESYRVTALGSCDQKLLTPNVCARLKDLNNEARAIWLRAGDLLKLAVKVEDSVQRQELLVRYNGLLAEFNKVFLDFVKLSQQLKKGANYGTDGDGGRTDLIARFAEWASDNRIAQENWN